MAIRLASAVGQQRTPTDMYGGLDSAINKTGDALQADLERSADAAAKKAGQDQRLKDLLASNVVITPPDRAVPEDQEYYKNFAQEGLFQIQKAALDPNVNPTQLEQMKTKFAYDLRDVKNKIETDYDVVTSVVDLAKNKQTHNDALFQNFLLGKTNPTQVAEMQGDDFFAASEKDRAGKMVGEGGMKATETETVYQDTPYFKRPMSERMKINTKEVAEKLVTPKEVGVEKAAKGYYGEDFDFQNLTKMIEVTNPTTGRKDFIYDPKEVDLLAKKYASSMLGKGNFGSKDHSIQQAAYEQEALVAGNDAGFSGQKLADFVEETVARRAYDDFTQAALTAQQKRMMNDKDVTKAPSKGLEINFTSGGGASKGSVTIEPVKDFTPLDKEGIKRAEQQTSELKNSVKKAEEIAAKYKSNPSSPAYQNAKKSLDASRKALLDLEEENLKRKEGFLMFSNKKAVDDAFIDINNDGKLMYRVVGFEPNTNGGYTVLGVERVKTDEGKVDKIKNMPLTESVYKKIIAENPDADKVMNELGVKPSAKVAAPKKEAVKVKAAPKVGTIQSGYKFIGGDPANPKNWKKI